MKIDYCPHCKLAITATYAPPDLTAAVVAAAREFLDAWTDGDVLMEADRLRTALAALDAAKGGK